MLKVSIYDRANTLNMKNCMCTIIMCGICNTCLHWPKNVQVNIKCISLHFIFAKYVFYESFIVIFDDFDKSTSLLFLYSDLRLVK